MLNIYQNIIVSGYIIISMGEGGSKAVEQKNRPKK